MVLYKQKCDAMLRSLSLPKPDAVAIAAQRSRELEDVTIMQFKTKLSQNSTTTDYKTVSKPLKNLTERMNKLREKAYKVIDKMNLLPNLSGDVDEFNKEFELLKEMERINKELGNVNLLMNAAAQNTLKSEENNNELLSETDSQLTISELLRSNDDEPKVFKENKVLSHEVEPLSNVDYLMGNDSSSCGRLCDEILVESQKQPSSQSYSLAKTTKTPSTHSSNYKSKLSYTHNPIKSLIRTFSNKNLKKDPSTQSTQQMFATTGILEYSSSLRDCQRNSSELNFSISGLLEESCDVDNIIKENEFLQKQIKTFQSDLDKAKKETLVYKTLLAKEKAKTNPKPVRKLSANLCKIKNILDSSAALPAFPETIEVLKSLCLLLLKKLNDTENQETCDQSSAQDDEHTNESAAMTATVNNNVLIVNSSTKVMLQNSTEILKAIEDLTKRTHIPNKLMEETSSNLIDDARATTSKVNSKKKLAPPIEIDFQQFAEKLKQQQENMKVFVQHIPKKPNATAKPMCQTSSLNGCDKIYLVFVK